MDIETLSKKARDIWGPEPMTLEHIIAVLGVVYGDICRQARNRAEQGELDEAELQKELGNLIFSAIRWCQDLGYDPVECIHLAEKSQARYASKT